MTELSSLVASSTMRRLGLRFFPPRIASFMSASLLLGEEHEWVSESIEIVWNHCSGIASLFLMSLQEVASMPISFRRYKSSDS